MEAEQYASDAEIRRYARRCRRGETPNASHPVDAIRASVRAFLRQTLNSYARLIWVRLPSAIFQQLSIQQTAGKTGKSQVKSAPDTGPFKVMIALVATAADQALAHAEAWHGGNKKQHGSRQMHH
ncbi:hypothetical protein [Pseudomonas sp. CFBP 8772]|uniref:hypothetical protein n=1 Tax=Pseudomonas sp. CFBP 8772 TaxID=2775284 RepID=UPI00177C76CE|nr:hypothetical protein [Pseudomonas sp. CFBP 8772]MBD8596236.1 hypothetical protein [Pseudomonas sp. CFBP 8772]